MKTVHLKSEAMDLMVQIDPNSIIAVAPPLVANFLGKTISVLIAWMGEQPGFEVEVVA